MNVTNTIVLINTLLLLLLYLLINIKGVKNAAVVAKILTMYIGLSCVTDIVLAITSTQGIHNHFIVNVFIVIEYLLLGIILLYWAGIASLKRGAILLAPLLSLGILNFFWNGFNSFNYINNYVETFVLLLLTGIVLIKLVTSTTENLLREYRFWITSGSLLYFVSSVIIFLLLNFSTSDNAAIAHLNYLNAAALIIRNVFFGIGIHHLIRTHS